MSEVLDERLKEHEEEVIKYSNEYNSILNEIIELDKRGVEVQKCKMLRNRLSRLEKRYENLHKEYIENKQLNCSHPLWYCEADSYEQSQLLLCQCVKCGITKEEHYREFKDKLIIIPRNMRMRVRRLFDTSYKKVQREYLKLESSNDEKDEIVKIMIKKYNY